MAEEGMRLWQRMRKNMKIVTTSICLLLLPLLRRTEHRNKLFQMAFQGHYVLLTLINLQP